jgi:hypothetical protein
VSEHVFVPWTPPDPWSYAYLLGLYLGDGHVAKMPRTTNLRITLDAVYPEIIADAVAATQLAALNNRVTRAQAP